MSVKWFLVCLWSYCVCWYDILSVDRFIRDRLFNLAWRLLKLLPYLTRSKVFCWPPPLNEVSSQLNCLGCYITLYALDKYWFHWWKLIMIDWLIDWLHITSCPIWEFLPICRYVCLFDSLEHHEQFFSYLAAVTITGDRAANLDLCLALTAFSREDSFMCHTYCDTGPPFIRSYLKDPWFSLHNAVSWRRSNHYLF
jgi:hypothetical protein